MTARAMIKALLDMPMDDQVVDTNGSPIMYMTYHDKNIFLEPKSQMDINAELDAFIEYSVKTGMSDYEAVDELKEKGYTLEDFKEYGNYDWAIQYW